MRNKILWSDETKVELIANCHVWRRAGTIPTVKFVDVFQGLGD
jgi:hypothetical protein